MTTSPGDVTSIERAGQPHRPAIGASVGPLSVTSASAERIAIPDPRYTTHLQLRRFAGCPICNLHLRSVAERHDEIVAAGIREVVVFHSTTAELQRYAPELPFPLVADPRRRLYRDFGVTPSRRALLDPRAWGAIMRGPMQAMSSHDSSPLRPSGGRLGLPGDFLIGSDGRLLAAKYGVHAYDQWSVSELLGLAAAVPAR